MTYDEQKAKQGKHPVYYIELQLDACPHTYGTAPCTASGPAADRCFNTYKTCQDKPNYAKDTIKVRFVSTRLEGLQQPGESPPFPVLDRIDVAPTRLAVGESIGLRARGKVMLKDFKAWDFGIDKYAAGRSVQALDQGTFIAKLIARNYYENRPIVVGTGYLTDDGKYNAANFVTREYLIKSINGPDSNQAVTIEIIDPLRIADNTRAQFPPPSSITLAQDIASNTSNNIAISDAQALADWVNQGTALSQPYIRISDEIMRVVSINTGGNTMTVSRADMPAWYDQTTNVASDHKNEDAIQFCWLVDEAPIQDVYEGILKGVLGIPDQYIDKTQWDDIISTSGYTAYQLSALLAEPYGTRDLLNELAQHNVYIFWHERLAKIVMGTYLPESFSNVEVSNANIVEGSLGIVQDTDGRITQVWLPYGHRNPTLKMDEAKNFAKVEAVADLEAESENVNADSRLKVIPSRWLKAGQSAVAAEISGRVIRDESQTKYQLAYTLTAKDEGAWTSDVVGAVLDEIQDAFGVPRRLLYRVIQVTENLGMDTNYRFIARQVFALDRAANIAPDEDPDNPGQPFPQYDDASELLRSQYAFISNNDTPPVMPDGTIAYQIR